MRRRLPALALLLALASAPLGAQQAPATDIWIGDLVRAGGSWRLDNVRNLTDRDGYDNQPWFLPDGSALFYTSQRDGQTDIYEIDLASGAARQVTKTPESEYSPQVTPDGSGISVVRVESDGTQRIWNFPLDGRAPNLVAPAARGVGYYAWLDRATLVAFVLGDPFTLQRIDLGDGKQTIVARQIGRSLHRIPGSHDASYSAPDGAGGDVTIFRYDPETGDCRAIGPAPPSENQDYAWTPDGSLVAGDGSRLLHRSPGSEASWIRFADLKAAGVHDITRLAVSPDGRRLALVAAR